jgi:RNA polymerase sigma factor (sigma-70 family)
MDIKHVKRDPNFNNEQSIKTAKESNSNELRDKVILNNIPLVMKLVNKWINRGSTEERDNLISMGLLGLVVAFDTYDTEKKVKFSTYAGKVVWGEFCKNVRYLEMKCRGKYAQISLSDNYLKKGSNKEMTIEEVLCSSDSYDQYEIINNHLYEESLIQAIGNTFTDKEKYIAKRHFIDGESISNIGRELNVSRQTIHQGHKRNVKKLAYLAV